MTAATRLAERGVSLPAVAAPLAAYVPAVRTGNLVYTSGQLPLAGGELIRTGKVGAEVSPEDAKAAARTCALNALAAIDALVGIDSVVRVVKVVGFVASSPGFSGRARSRVLSRAAFTKRLQAESRAALRISSWELPA